MALIKKSELKHLGSYNFLVFMTTLKFSLSYKSLLTKVVRDCDLHATDA